ncbi:6329_t:CDS:2 [Funneliformis caledonium]|uniref:6329_t:CDS:1 n=1 Tax=Funneliformis caledonium TaxID=1117310 RepID=A0A9N9DTG1_9GLOM|nr:6329_t:CDS:2 [Funneliformis caledonium]
MDYLVSLSSGTGTMVELFFSSKVHTVDFTPSRISTDPSTCKVGTGRTMVELFFSSKVHTIDFTASRISTDPSTCKGLHSGEETKCHVERTRSTFYMECFP